MPKNKLLIPFVILLTANIICGVYWLVTFTDIKSIILPNIRHELINEFPIQPKANYYGWIGGDRINLTIHYGTATFHGMYTDKNKNEFELTMPGEISPTDKSLKWNVTKFSDQKVLGTLEVFATDETGSKINLTQGLTLFDTQVLRGIYQPKSGLSEDVYLTQDQQRVEWWTSKPLQGKIYKSKNIERPTYFVDMGSDGGQFFSYETWWFDQFKDGDEVNFVGKIRQYNDKQKFDKFETNQGIFDIKSVLKI